MDKTRGILLIALGHVNYYRMALNLAVSIKTKEEFPICLITDKEPTDIEKRFFDIVIQKRTPNPIGVKLEIYDLSPFDETIFLDSDMLWLPRKKPSELFDEVAGKSFACASEGFIDLDRDVSHASKHYTFWFNVEDAKSYYNKTNGVIRQLRSEVVYFEKTEENKFLFDLAKDIYREPRLAVEAFAATLPDEFAFNLAFWLLDRQPFIHFSPAYWEYTEGLMPAMKVYDVYFLLSIGGIRLGKISKKIYNDIVKNYSNRHGIAHPFYAISKKEYLKEREVI